MRAVRAPEADLRLVLRVAAWFEASARPLPWRPADLRAPRDPYRALVSEFMLQQTQAARVAERFDAFIRRFPTVRDLARASEADVLAAWSGLGYYARARRLAAAAREIEHRFGGRLPADAAELRALPGVGRYTAGSLASIVFGRPEPIVDGNVARVLLRIDGRRLAHGAGVRHAWVRAEQLAAVAHRAGVIAFFNEGLMELGATLCSPRSARCGPCPAASCCRARAAGSQDRIPRPRPAPRRTRLRCDVVVVTDRAGRLLVERRAAGGLWPGLWQPPTRTHGPRDGPASDRPLATDLRLPGLGVLGPADETFEHATTHRLIEFRVWRPAAVGGRRAGTLAASGRRWVGRDELGGLGLSSPARRILLGGPESAGGRAG